MSKIILDTDPVWWETLFDLNDNTVLKLYYDLISLNKYGLASKVELELKARNLTYYEYHKEKTRKS